MYQFNPVKDDTELVSVSYMFMKPFRCYVKHKDNSLTLTGFGIGEIIYVMVPKVQTLQTNYEILSVIPLKNGDVILDAEGNIPIKKVCLWPLQKFIYSLL